jgi:hypothetical protein
MTPSCYAFGGEPLGLVLFAWTSMKMRRHLWASASDPTGSGKEHPGEHACMVN